MSDATDAIIDIEEALEEYGSAITINIVAVGEYDTTTGEITVSLGDVIECDAVFACDAVIACGTGAVGTDIVTKCIVSSYDSQELLSDNIYAKDLKFKLYYNGEVGYSDTLTFNGRTYNLINIDKKIFQDINIIYTIQGRV